MSFETCSNQTNFPGRYDMSTPWQQVVGPGEGSGESARRLGGGEAGSLLHRRERVPQPRRRLEEPRTFRQALEVGDDRHQEEIGDRKLVAGEPRRLRVA